MAWQGLMAAGKYTKADIIDSLCEKTGVSRKLIRIIIDLFTDEIKEALTRDLSIELRGFGTFEVKLRKGRPRARNPKTGEEVAVTSHGIAVFRPGQELKQAVWNRGSIEAADLRPLPDTHESDF
jgi:integration host factor subunit beta